MMIREYAVINKGSFKKCCLVFEIPALGLNCVNSLKQFHKVHPGIFNFFPKLSTPNDPF